MNTFWEGFEKRALQPTRTKEDLAVAGTAAIPFGTTLHTLLSGGGDKGKEWLSRIGGSIGGGSLGALLGALATRGKSPLAPQLTGLAGGLGGEVAASRLVHSGKYTPEGKLKPGASKK